TGRRVSEASAANPRNLRRSLRVSSPRAGWDRPPHVRLAHSDRRGPAFLRLLAATRPHRLGGGRRRRPPWPGDGRTAAREWRRRTPSRTEQEIGFGNPYRWGWRRSAPALATRSTRRGGPCPESRN